MKFIPYGCQDINEQDIQAVVDVLRSDYLTQGPTIEKFEKALATYCAAKYALVMSNATAALHLACLALNVQAQDEVWTSPNTFVATANSALYCGAHVKFIDIDPKTYNISVVALEENLIAAAKINRLPKIVTVVHFAGQSCAMRAIKNLAAQYGFKIIEDAAHAIGGKYLQRPVGNCEYSDLAILSFHPVKIITCGEGGAILSNDQALMEKIAYLRTHGVTRKSQLMQKEKPEGWYYEHIALGFNYRMTDLQAALGLSQLNRIDDFVQKRHQLAARYNQLLASFPLQLPAQDSDNYSSFHLYPILFANKTKRDQAYQYLRQANIGVNLHYIPVYKHPYYQAQMPVPHCPVMEDYYARTLTLPLHPKLTLVQQDYIVQKLSETLN